MTNPLATIMKTRPGAILALGIALLTPSRFILLPGNLQPLQERVLVVSGSTVWWAWTHNVTWNQHLFTAMHDNLDYAFVDVEASQGLLGGRESYQPQWLKIRILQDLLMAGAGAVYRYILWMDDDIVVTSPNNFIEDMMDRIGEDQDLLLAEDAGDPNGGVNTGIMLFRATQRSQGLLDSIWSMTAHKAPGGTLGTCRNQRCLHEQAAINVLREQDPQFRSAVRVVHPVEDEGFNMNTFYRRSHVDNERRIKMKYDKDPERYRWSPDRRLNTCHVTGMARSLRAAMIDTCLQVAEQEFMQKASKLATSRDSFPFRSLEATRAAEVFSHQAKLAAEAAAMAAEARPRRPSVFEFRPKKAAPRSRGSPSTPRMKGLYMSTPAPTIRSVLPHFPSPPSFGSTVTAIALSVPKRSGGCSTAVSSTHLAKTRRPSTVAAVALWVPKRSGGCSTAVSTHLAKTRRPLGLANQHRSPSRLVAKELLWTPPARRSRGGGISGLGGKSERAHSGKGRVTGISAYGGLGAKSAKTARSKRVSAKQ
eukprot:TRINITY_DN8619_c0_g1_i1.p1 TRINITY_DN8619_c0_g1~~TRINITY_DN8619_c0_g1_i1.p1  ORF type:complete len:535 (-),score=82.77 TRINITY_DN8619_c0_g1_i1:79-1683(-)